MDLDEKPTPKGEKSKLSKPIKAIFDMVEQSKTSLGRPDVSCIC